MKKGKKCLALVLALSMLAGMFAACKGASSTSSDGKITRLLLLRFSRLWTQLMRNSGKTRLNMFRLPRLRKLRDMSRMFTWRLYGLSDEEVRSFTECSDMNTPGMIRVSFGIYNTEEEVDYLLEVLPKAVKEAKNSEPAKLGMANPKY